MLEETIIEIWNSVDSKFTQKSHEFTAMERRRETYYQRWPNKISMLNNTKRSNTFIY